MNEPKRTLLTPEEQKEKERLMRSGELSGEIKLGKISEDFWALLWPEDPEGLLLKALLDDRRQGR